MFTVIRRSFKYSIYLLPLRETNVSRIFFFILFSYTLFYMIRGQIGLNLRLNQLDYGIESLFSKQSSLASSFMGETTLKCNMHISSNFRAGNAGCGVCVTLLWFYTSKEHLKRMHTSPQPILEATYFRQNTYLIIIYKFHIKSLCLKCTFFQIFIISFHDW